MISTISMVCRVKSEIRNANQRKNLLSLFYFIIYLIKTLRKNIQNFRDKNYGKNPSHTLRALCGLFTES